MAAIILDFRTVSGAELASGRRPTDSGGIRSSAAGQALELHAAREPGHALELTALWRHLMTGEWFAWSGFCSADECYLVIGKREARVKPKLRPHSVAMLEQVLTGETQKGLAIDARLAHSTVAGRCTSSLKSIGAEHTLSCVPTLYLLAAHAARGMRLEPARVRPITTSEPERWLVSYERPDSSLHEYLTDAERDVVRLLIEGRTHAQMALVRQRSKRTIANQLGSAFRKLGVSGRAALVAKLLQLKRSPADADSERRLH